MKALSPPLLLAYRRFILAWRAFAEARLPFASRLRRLLSRRDADRALLLLRQISPDPNQARGPWLASVLDEAIRQRLEPVALEALRLGADPFAISSCRDDQGRSLRLRPFEAAICLDWQAFLLECLRSQGLDAIHRQRLEWRSVSFDTHPSLLPWRTGSGWFHLAAATGAARSVAALRSLGLQAFELDSFGGTPLLACAISRGGIHCAAELMLAGDNLHLPDAFGSLPSDYVGDAWESAAALLEADSIAQASDLPGLASPSAPRRSL